MPDVTQVQSFHDTIREWAYIGAQACANRENQCRSTLGGADWRQKVSCRKVLRGSLLGSTSGTGGGQTSCGERVLQHKANQEGLGSPKGSSGAMLERPGPRPFIGTVTDYTPQERHVIWSKARLHIREILKEKHISPHHSQPLG